MPEQYLGMQALVGMVLVVHPGLGKALPLLGAHIVVAERSGASPELAVVRAESTAALPRALHVPRVRHPAHHSRSHCAALGVRSHEHVLIICTCYGISGTTLKHWSWQARTAACYCIQLRVQIAVLLLYTTSAGSGFSRCSWRTCMVARHSGLRRRRAALGTWGGGGA